jgi:hypothetical protein
MKVRGLLALLLVLWLALRWAGAEPQQSTPALETEQPAIDEISLLTANGLVPVEHIVFRSDGRVTRISSRRQVDPRIDDEAFQVRAEGKLPPLQWQRLVALVESIRFEELNSIYSSYDWEPSYHLAVVRGETKKGITDRNGNTFGGAKTPIGLWGLEMALRGLVADVDWQKLEDAPPQQP